VGKIYFTGFVDYSSWRFYAVNSRFAFVHTIYALYIQITYTHYIYRCIIYYHKILYILQTTIVSETSADYATPSALLESNNKNNTATTKKIVPTSISSGISFFVWLLLGEIIILYAYIVNICIPYKLSINKNYNMFFFF